MIRHIQSLFILLLAAFALSSCDRKVSVVLDDVESYIQAQPDSALSVIRSIDTTSLKTRRARAQYSLLHAMALDKNWIDTTDIGIITPALEYYAERGDHTYRMMSNYYAGRIYANSADNANAIVRFDEALALADTNDFHYLGLIYSGISRAYHSSFNFREEQENAHLSYEAFQKAGDDKNTQYALYGFANALHNNREFQKSDSLYRMLLSQTDSLSSLANYAKTALADNALKSDIFDAGEICNLYESVIRNGGDLTVADYYEYAFALCSAGKVQASEEVLNKISSYPLGSTAYWWLYKIEKERGNVKLAEDYLEKSVFLQDKTIREKIVQSVYKAQANHYRFLNKVSEQQKIISMQKSIIALFAIVIIILALAYLARNHFTRIKEERDSALLTAEQMGQLLESISAKAESEKMKSNDDLRLEKEKLTNLQRRYVTLFQNQFKKISEIYDPYNKNRMESLTVSISRDASRSIERIIEEISSESESWSKFESKINEELDNVIKKIREDFPEYSDKDIQFICLDISGFDTYSISNLMNISTGYVRTKRHRIHKKLKASGSVNSDLYNALF